MSDLFKREIFRPVVTLLVPGIVALSPFGLKIILTYPGLQEFATSNPGATVIICGVFCIVAGLILEDLGALIETLWDTILDKAKKAKGGKEGRTQGQHIDIWKRYRKLTFQSDPVGQNYLRTLLIRFKFELSMVIALPVSWTGFGWLHMTQTYLWHGRAFLWDATAFWVGSFLAFLLAAYLLWESFNSAKTIGQTRKLLVEKYETP